MSLPENYKALRYRNEGLVFETLKLEKPGKDQVVVKIEFAPIHPSDNDMMKGLYTIDLSRPGLLGSEASGVIAAIGEDLKVPHKVGDRVAIIGFGAYAEYVTLKSEDAIPLLDNLSLEEASLHFINPGTVYEMGIRAEEEGHKAAINTAASSALGRLLIKLFKHKGIKLINVVRNDKYIEELKKEGADYVLNSQSPTFEKDLKELIDKEGVTLAFDGVGGDSVEQLLRLLPEYGTCYGYGNLSLSSHTKFNFIVPIIGEKTFRGLGFSTYYRKLTREGKNLAYMREVHALLPTVLKQDIEKVFKVQDVKDAMSYFDEKKPQGKVLLKF